LFRLETVDARLLDEVERVAEVRLRSDPFDRGLRERFPEEEDRQLVRAAVTVKGNGGHAEAIVRREVLNSLGDLGGFEGAPHLKKQSVQPDHVFFPHVHPTRRSE